MKKSGLMIVSILVIAGMLTGCCISHDWQAATCTTPKTCTTCEKVEGEVLGHDWKEATCEDAKICSRCGEIEGSALGHDWQDATCENAKTCKICEKTEGEALGHNLAEATYLTPATCTVCNEVHGEVLQPTATQEEIDEMQVRMESFAQTYNTGNKEIIDALSVYSASNYLEEDIDELLTVFDASLDKSFEFKTNYAWCCSAVPMVFYTRVNEDYTREWEFENCLAIGVDAINEYIEVLQENKNDMKLGGMAFFSTMRYVKEIAEGNPQVLDIVYYDEPHKIEGMCVQAIGHGVINVSGEIYHAYLMEDNYIVDIYPADMEYFSSEN